MLFHKCFACFALLAATTSFVQAVTLMQLHTRALALLREDPRKLEWVIDMMWREHMGYYSPRPIALDNPSDLFLRMEMTANHSLQNLVHK